MLADKLFLYKKAAGAGLIGSGRAVNTNPSISKTNILNPNKNIGSEGSLIEKNKPTSQTNAAYKPVQSESKKVDLKAPKGSQMTTTGGKN